MTPAEIRAAWRQSIPAPLREPATPHPPGAGGEGAELCRGCGQRTGGHCGCGLDQLVVEPPARLDQGEGTWSVGQRVICDGYGDVLEVIEVDVERSRLAMRHADGWRSEVPMSYATPTDLPLGARVPRCRSGVPGEWRCVGQRGTPHDCSSLRGPWADVEDDPPAPSQAAGREVTVRVRGRILRGRVVPAEDVPLDGWEGAPTSFAAWAQSLARWTPPPPKPTTLFDAARAWLARRHARWLASEAERVAAIRAAEEAAAERARAERARQRAPEMAAVNRALVGGSLGVATGGLPIDEER
jgi:hypothetical protein